MSVEWWTLCREQGASRRAKLYALPSDRPAEHIGYAVEYTHGVEVELPESEAFPRLYDETFIRGKVETIGTTYVRVGDPTYFEHVLHDISRTYAVVMDDDAPSASTLPEATP